MEAALDFRETTTPPLRRLSEQDAWAIAMTWQPYLQGRVRLVVDCDGPLDSIIKSYAWVSMWVPRALSKPRGDAAARRREQMSVMRAVMVSWAALAAYPGYSAAQNPSFWKRVLCQLQAIDEPSERPHAEPAIVLPPGLHSYPESMEMPIMVVDAYGFFNRPGHSFPRFAVNKPPSMNDAFCRLFSPDGPDLTLEVRDKLSVILTRLQLHSSDGSSTATRVPRIDIRLAMRPGYLFRTEDTAALASLVATVNGPSSGSIVHPFRIAQLKIRERLQLSSQADVDGFFNLAQAVPVPLTYFYFSPLLNKVSRDVVATWLYAFLRLDGHGVQAAVTAFAFPRSHAKEAVFQAFMSALPFATSVHSLTFADTERSECHGTFESHDLPWIAYAIFHPRAASSSWRYLSLYRLTLTVQTSRILSAMARGNNLLQLLNGTTPDSDAYYSARLRGGTVIEVKRGQTVVSLDVPARGEVLFAVPSSGITVDVCGISSLNPATWSEWVAVIVPAYGLGLVRASDLHDVQTHAPATRSLSGVQLHRRFDGSYRAIEEPPESVLQFVRPLGHMLTYLDVGSYSNMSATTLHEILRACPALKSLVVSHQGDFWTSDHVDGMPPYETALEELDLCIGSSHSCVATPSRAYLTTSLRHLRALRIRASQTHSDKLLASREALEQLLRHAPALRYVHWRDADADFWLMRETALRIPYETSLEWTPAALERLGLTEIAGQRTHRSLAPSRVAAFLSVVVCKSKEGSCIGRLADPALLARIFSFAANARFVFIEPSDKDPRRRSLVSVEEESTEETGQQPLMPVPGAVRNWCRQVLTAPVRWIKGRL